MFSVDRAPQYVAETLAGAARLQEGTAPERYEALAERARRLLDGMFRVETNVDPELQVKIVLRERFQAARAKQAILMVATWKLISDLAAAWSVRGRKASPLAAPSLAAPALAGTR